MVRGYFPNAKDYLDPGHVAKNLKKNIATLKIGMGEHVCRLYFWAKANSNNDYEVFRSLWRGVYGHVQVFLLYSTDIYVIYNIHQGDHTLCTDMCDKSRLPPKKPINPDKLKKMKGYIDKVYNLAPRIIHRYHIYIFI